MKYNNKTYKRLGDYIEQVNVRNSELLDVPLLGINIDKHFMPSVANIIGTDLSRYKLVHKNQFACNRMHVGRDNRIPIAISESDTPFMVSPAYDVFRIIDESLLNPHYLMMWFQRKEFDRECTFYTDADVRLGLPRDSFEDLRIKIPSIEEQQKIVSEYQAIENKIKVNEQICEKLEATAQAIYREWFVEFNFPDENGKPYKDNGGKMVWNEELEKDVPEGWEVRELGDIATIIMGQSPSGESYNEEGEGAIFYQGRTDFGFRVPTVRMFTKEPKRMAKEGDVLMSVRAPVGDLNITEESCCIGRGIASIRSKESSYIFYLLKEYKYYFDSSEGTGTIFSSINKDELYGLKSTYQIDKSVLFHSLIKNIDKKIINKSTVNKRLTQLKSLRLARMVK